MVLCTGLWPLLMARNCGGCVECIIRYFRLQGHMNCGHSLSWATSVRLERRSRMWSPCTRYEARGLSLCLVLCYLGARAP